MVTSDDEWAAAVDASLRRLDEDPEMAAEYRREAQEMAEATVGDGLEDEPW